MRSLRPQIRVHHALVVFTYFYDRDKAADKGWSETTQELASLVLRLSSDVPPPTDVREVIEATGYKED